MTLQQMEFFITAAKCGSFTAAAKKYYTTQPTVSRQISLLEDELGYLLLDRQAKPLELTAAGRVIFQHYTEIVNQIQLAGILGKMADQGQFGHLTIAFTEDLTIEDYFTDLLENIRESFEGLHLKFTKIPMQDMQEYLLTRQGDLVISLHLSLMDYEEISVLDLFPIECFILMAKNHPLAAKEHLDKEDLINEIVYLPEPFQCYSIYNNDFCGLTLNRKKLIPTSTIDIALMNLKFAGGVTCANSMMQASYDENFFKKFPVPDPTYVPPVAMAWNRNSTNPAIAFFKDLAKAHFLKHS